jgi:hypothetical protein
MAEPTLRLTFEDLILRLAEYLSLAYYGASGDEKAQVPTDAHDLDLCKRLVNDGYRRFYNSNPAWNWTDRLFSITFDPDAAGDGVVDGENWRYYMPDGFYGHMLGRMTYPENQGYLDLTECAEDVIRSLYAESDISGYPSKYAIRPLHGDDRRRWEMIVWPKPTSSHTITGRCRIYPNKLVELTDTPNAGQQFDEAILAAVLAEAEKTREGTAGVMESAWAEALVRAVAIDQKTAPRRVGDYGPGRGRVPGRVYTGVDSYTNADGNTFEFEL